MVAKRFETGVQINAGAEGLVIQQNTGSVVSPFQILSHDATPMFTIHTTGEVSAPMGIDIGSASKEEINYLSGVSDNIQTQIDSKAPSATPTFTGQVTLPSTTTIGSVSAAEIGYLDGVTSSIQNQIDLKANSATPTFVGPTTLPLTTTIGTVTATEISYLSGVTSSIQTQLNSKLSTAVTSLTGTANRITVSTSTGAVTLNLPQDIHTGAAPTFAGMTLTGNITVPNTSATYFGSANGSNFWRPIDAFNNSYIKIGTGGFYVDSDSYFFRTASSGNILTLSSSGADLYTDLLVRKTNAGGGGAMLRLENQSATSGTRAGIFFSVDTGVATWADAGNAEIICTNSGQSQYGILSFFVFDSARSEAMKIVGHGINYTSAENTSYNLRNGVAFGSAGVAIDKGWNGYPGINVFNTNVYGDTRQGEFRIHGWSKTFSSYPADGGSDFGVNVRIDGASYLTSDARCKVNIVDNPYGLNEIMQLKPRKFDRINSAGQLDPNISNVLGFIAQEVMDVIPEAVKYYEDEDVPNEIGWCRAYSLNEGHIISTLVNAVKELAEKVKILESK